MKKYKVIITSNTGEKNFEYFECEDISVYLVNRNALREVNYFFNGSYYYANYIFKIQFEEIT